MRAKKVLLVEDDASVLFLMKEHLRTLEPRLQVVAVRSGEEALQKIHQGIFDLFVTDYQIPDTDGLNLITALKEKNPATPAILMTPWESEEIKQKADHLSIFRYLEKPFHLNHLARVIQDALTAAPQARTCLPADDCRLQQPMKVTLGGDGGVGKTTLVRRLCTGQFDPTRKITIGVDFHLYDLQVGESPARLIIWDVSGQERFAFTRKAFYRGSKAVGLVYAVNDRLSFERLDQWLAEIREILPDTPVVLAGNKSDLDRQVSFEEGRALADRWGVPFIETNCQDGQGVQNLFGVLLSQAAHYATHAN